MAILETLFRVGFHLLEQNISVDGQGLIAEDLE